MRVIELLQITESRSAPLYHWLGNVKLASVLEHDMMPAWWEHQLPWSNERVEGNSLSRNPRFKYPTTGRTVRLTFNQDALSRTNRIIPMDAEVVFSHSERAPDTLQDRSKPMSGEGDENVMAEEFVVGNIKPLHKYLTEIGVIGDSSTRTIQMIKEYSEKYSIPVKYSLN